jgi:hypothetical protein
MLQSNFLLQDFTAQEFFEAHQATHFQDYQFHITKSCIHYLTSAASNISISQAVLDIPLQNYYNSRKLHKLGLQHFPFVPYAAYNFSYYLNTSQDLLGDLVQHFMQTSNTALHLTCKWILEHQDTYWDGYCFSIIETNTSSYFLGICLNWPTDFLASKMGISCSNQIPRTKRGATLLIHASRHGQADLIGHWLKSWSNYKVS